MATSPTSASTSKRIDLLDLWRGVAVLFMIAWHAMWDLNHLGLLSGRVLWGRASLMSRDFIIFSFLLLSGISSRYSRSNVRRGLRLGVLAVGITVVMHFFGEPVLFGVLHLLCVCTLMWGLLERWLRRVPDWLGVLLPLLAFFPLRALLEPLRVEVTWLWWLGFRTQSFYSSDYYPILPWMLLFLAGAYLGGFVQRSRGKWKSVALPPALTWPGRHALLIYLVHQPLLYGLSWLLARYLG